MEFENEKFVIDSNIFIAFYHKGDSSHGLALEIFGNLLKKTLIVHPYVVQETATVLAYKAGRAVAVQFLTDIRNSANVIVPLVFIDDDIQSFIAAPKKISFTDSALIGLARQMDAQLVTFDRQMLKIYKN